TSNVIVASEQGLPQTGGGDVRSCLWDGAAWHGATTTDVPTTASAGQFGGGQWSLNMTTVRYGINVRTTGLPGASAGYNANVPLTSRHTGGVHATKGDGSVIFLSENIEFVTLLRLAVISDENTVGEH